MIIHVLRHAESVANSQEILAGQLDYPLSEKGKEDARCIATQYRKQYSPQIAYCSPLLRARQTAEPFLIDQNIPLMIDQRLIEQDIGMFSGMTYRAAEADSRYETDRAKRWQWRPPHGESYEDIAKRITSFFNSLDQSYDCCILFTHAVTMRILKGVLEHTLPLYPQEIARNGEIWECKFLGLGKEHQITSILFDDLTYDSHKA